MEAENWLRNDLRKYLQDKKNHLWKNRSENPLFSFIGRYVEIDDVVKYKPFLT